MVPKKRGNRWTGSKLWGRLIEGAFFAAVLVAGCVGLVVVLVRVVVPEWRANHQFVEHRCLVLDKRLGTQAGSDGTRYRPEIRIQYTVGGEKYVVRAYPIRGQYSADRAAVQQILRGFERDQECPCWYDPADPSKAVLVRGYSWYFWLTLAMPVSFILIGGGGLVYILVTWGKSAERRAALAGRVGGAEHAEGNGRPAQEFPYVPKPAATTDSPGTTLAYRLPMSAASGWKLFLGLVACLGWNGIVSLFACVAISGFLEGRPDWMLALFILPFLAVGVAMIVYLFRWVLVATAVGPTLVEVSQQPLQPGGQYELLVSQTGRLRMNALEVLLVCDEEATYHQGTNARRESLRVCQQLVYRRGRFQVRHGEPFEARCPLELPVGAMHSFKSPHNEINWKIVVKGEVSGWPSFARAFPVIVYPPANGHNGKPRP